DWYRTDKNGRITFTIGQDIGVDFGGGTKDDSSPNSRDVAVGEGEQGLVAEPTHEAAEPAPAAPPAPASIGSGGDAEFEIDDVRGLRFKIPAGTKIGFTLEIPGGATPADGDSYKKKALSDDAIRVGGGRNLP